MPAGDGAGLRLLIGEGVVTAISLHTATADPAFASLSCGNLTKAALALQARYPAGAITICGDRGNGSRHAHEAALAVGGLVAFPSLSRPGADFNDEAQELGSDAVKRAVANATAPDVSIRPRRRQRCRRGPQVARGPTRRGDARYCR